MSSYAYLVCDEGEEMFFVGKAGFVSPSDGAARLVNIAFPPPHEMRAGKESGTDRLGRATVVKLRALMVFLTRHHGRVLAVMLDHEVSDRRFEKYVEIGGPPPNGVSYADYAAGDGGP